MDNTEIKNQKSKLMKRILVLLIVIGIGIMGVTLAINKQSKAVVTTGNYNVEITGDTNVKGINLTPINNTSDTIAPGNLSNYTGSIYVSSFTVKGADGNPEDIPIIYDIALIEQNIDTGLLNKYLKWELIKNNEIIANGNFYGMVNNTRYVLTNIQQDLPEYTETADSLKFVMWINDNFDDGFDQSTMMNRTFSAKIDVELYTESKVGSE